MLKKAPWTIGNSLVLFALPWVILPLVLGLELGVLAQILPVFKHVLALFESDSIAAGFGLVILEALAALLLLQNFLKHYGAHWRDLGLRRFNLGWAIVFIGGTFLALGLLVAGAFALVKLLLPGFNPNQAQVNEFTQAVTPLGRRVSFLALVVVPPFIEEMVFRGFAFPAFAKRTGVIWGAVLSSALFGAAHLLGSGPNVAIYTMILGLLLCLMYRKLGSIWPGIALHMLNNYLAYMVIVGK